MTHCHPIFFILCTEGLSSILKHYERIGELHGIKLCRGALTISHLLFADDCFLFCRATKKETSTLINIPNIYGIAFGQLTNFQKFEVFFSSYTKIDVRHKIMSLRQNISKANLIEIGKYLELPSIIGRKNFIFFSFLKDKLWKRINH